MVVQPRMGFSSPKRMREGLAATKAAAARTVGTITVDSYTRTECYAAADRAAAVGLDLNGYPIVAHSTDTTRAMLDGVQDASFPIQVRHGSASPEEILRASLSAGLYAGEGGPVSYCLPYGRTPLRAAVSNWSAACEALADAGDGGVQPHLESFGGCMLGQLCPPSLLVAITLLEGLFFRQHGLRSISLSYAQQPNEEQDEEAILALRRLASEMLSDTDWHVVVYAHMGVYPRTRRGARRLLGEAARLAARTGAERLVVKTSAEAHRIPTVAENIEALELAASAAGYIDAHLTEGAAGENEAYAEALAIVEAVLSLDSDVGTALIRAFERGHLDVPYCLHADNHGRAKSYIAQDGRVRWSDTGSIPIPRSAVSPREGQLGSNGLLAALRYVERKFDGPEAEQPIGMAHAADVS